MKIWVTTDTHFNHANMIPYCGRPHNFDDLIWKGLSVVKPDDILIHLGDICFGGEDEKINNIFQSIVCGRKILVKGNHDKKTSSWYLGYWDFVCDYFKGVYFGKHILFSHQPMRIDDNINFNIHGHFHNNLPRLLEKKFVVEGEEERNKDDLSVLTNRHKLIALELTNYKPVDLEKIICG